MANWRGASTTAVTPTAPTGNTLSPGRTNSCITSPHFCHPLRDKSRRLLPIISPLLEPTPTPSSLTNSCSKRQKRTTSTLILKATPSRADGAQPIIRTSLPTGSTTFSDGMPLTLAGAATRPKIFYGASRTANSTASIRKSLCYLPARSEEHTSELQSRFDLVCRLLLEKKKSRKTTPNA